MKALSLFAGIGGIDLGIEMMGWETVAFSEFDPKIAKKKNGRQYAAEVMQRQFPEATSVGDIERLVFARNKQGVPGILMRGEEGEPLNLLFKGELDLIVGGFPCQDISLAGKGAGIEDGTRSGLWRYFAEAIGGLRPSGVIIENVAALAGKGLDRVLRDLNDLGYDAEWDVIAAAGIGAPHLRERMFILAWPQGDGDHGPWVTPPVFDAWLTEPVDMPRLTTEDVEQRTARLRCLGNSVVPQVAAWVAATLADRIDSCRPNAGMPIDLTDAKHGRGELKGQSKHLGRAGELPKKLPRAGRMTSGECYERKRSCTQAEAKATGLKYMAATLRPRADAPGTHTSDGLLTTPTASDARDGIRAEGFDQGGTSLPTQASRLVPTPTAKDADSSRSCTAVREVEPARASQMGETLTDYVDPTNGGRLLPTPQAADGDRTTDYQQRSDGSNPTLQGATKLLPTPTVSDGGASDHRAGGANLEHEAKLLPTPTVADATGSRASKGTDRPDEGGLLAHAKLLPTPKATDGDKGVRSQQGAENEMARGKGGDLNAAAALLPTPRACTGVRSSGMNRGEMMDALAELEPAGHLIPTPRASEWKGTGPLGSKSHDYRVEKGYLDATMQEMEQKTGRLNPEWVGWLCGFPAGWTIL